ncbi:MAG: hypothetical protein QM820_37225 [Minicystis sp.]
MRMSTALAIAGALVLGCSSEPETVMGTGGTGGTTNASGSWAPMSTEGEPSPRVLATEVWTGKEMVVWGGTLGCAEISCADGSRYDPKLDAWTSIASAGAPSGRDMHGAVWTGEEMIVWGGQDCGGQPLSVCGDGAAYDPAKDTWRKVASEGAPAARGKPSAVWTGKEMIVWGGQTAQNGALLGDGAAYDPALDAWRPIAAAGAPSPRRYHATIWTGKEMIVWGGDGEPSMSSPLGEGARYDPAADTWAPMSSEGAPSPRWSHAAAWTGTLMIVWGGVGCSGGVGDGWLECSGGAAYDPAKDRWTAVTPKGGPIAVSGHRALWTGDRVLVYGGALAPPFGGLYDPASDRWTPTALLPMKPRVDSSIVWTGSEMLVWSGMDGEFPLAGGARFTP